MCFGVSVLLHRLACNLVAHMNEGDQFRRWFIAKTISNRLPETKQTAANDGCTRARCFLSHVKNSVTSIFAR